MSISKNNVITVILWIARIFFGAVFIFSGFVKAVDPLGSAYKFEDYFIDAFNMDWMLFAALPMAFVMNIVEMLVGFTIILGLQFKLSAWIGLLFMAFFTPLTLYIAITDPVSDCGCFGDAIIFTNWETFYKNIYLSAAIVFIFIYKERVKPLISFKGDLKITAAILLASVIFSGYCLRYLPVIDFRPWKVGNYIPNKLKDIKEAEVERVFIYKNNETGETIEVSEEMVMKGEIPDSDTHTFKERDEIEIEPGIPAPIANFAIYDDFGDNYTDYYLYYPEHILFVIIYDINSANKRSIEKRLLPLINDAKENGLKSIILTSSLPSDIDSFVEKYDITHNIYEVEERELKTIVRSNPGLVLMKEGTVIEKWPHRRIPDFKRLKKIM